MSVSISLDSLVKMAENVTAYTRATEPNHPMVIYIDKFINHIETLYRPLEITEDLDKEDYYNDQDYYQEVYSQSAEDTIWN